MKAGRLRHRVTIQKNFQSRTRGAGLSDDWRDVAEVWAAVEPLSEKALFEAQTIRPEITHRVIIRYREGVQVVDHRFKFGDRYLYPESIIDGRSIHRELTCLCREEETRG